MFMESLKNHVAKKDGFWYWVFGGMHDGGECMVQRCWAKYAKILKSFVKHDLWAK